MQQASNIRRLALGLALSLYAVSMVAIAAEVSETTEVEVVVAGNSEKVTIENLAVGETRQLYSEAGTLVTATRTAESLELDIGGEKTSIKMLGSASLHDPEVIALFKAESDDGQPRERRIVRVHADKRASHGEHADGERPRIMVFTDTDGDVHEIDDENMHVIINQGEGGKQVTVKRRIVQDSDD